MRLVSVYSFALGISALAALPLSAQLLPSPNSVLWKAAETAL
jgi:hypothetical protein